MLRVTVYKGAAATTIQVEGKLAGAEVKELAGCWLGLLTADPHQPIVVDLKEIGFIDASGKGLLAEMHKRGAKLLAADCMTRAVVEEVDRGNW
jgi:anti-anti-sigma regulatory factor